MPLEVGDRIDRPSVTPEQQVLRERADELREWLVHLEGWVEMQMTATRALVARLTDSREPDAGPRQAGSKRGAG